MSFWTAAACRRFESGAKAPHSKRALVAALLLVPQIANACPVCFGGPSSGGEGMNAAIIFLLSVVGVVQLGFVALFISFWRRARELRRKRESFRLLEGGVR